ncbi:MAG: GNAT family N-acetyltransferase [Erythrobacter sp.]|uniref:GNAT family N-acetyltransferase n=1 Tax=Erythrobacter sp. TaxID=1042 RepID=UPI0025FD48D9|nr:GNAT family N-acetyltransferase [Erythrobacter sp.]MCL9999649.1 GNAT family N-acetyltransferase [Erythrobacter sp.]
MRSALVRIPPALAAQGMALRPETAADDPYLLALYATTRAAELDQVADWTAAQKQAFVAMQFDAQRRHYRTALENVAFDVITRGGAPIGRLYTQEGETMLHIVDILIDPAERGAGVGTALLQGLAADARAAGKVLSIFVESYNPARRLYERLGFVAVGEPRGFYIEMEIPLP